MDGILIVGYGGPEKLSQVEPFMESLTGRPSTPEMLQKITARYELIGGGSPLVPIAREIAEALESQLDSVPVELGMLHSEPSIEDGFARLIETGVDRVVCISLSPFYSTASNGRAYAAIGEIAPLYPHTEVLIASELGQFAGFALAHAHALTEAFDAADVASDDVALAFTAHSVPMSDVEAGDYVYANGLERVADALVEALYLSPATPEGYPVGEEASAHGTTALPRPWANVYHSQGMRGGAWLGPSLPDFIRTAHAHGAGAIVVCPLGFATDHLETRYDLDIAAKALADELDIAFVRSAAPNTSPHLIDAFVAAYADAIGADAADVVVAPGVDIDEDDASDIGRTGGVYVPEGLD